MAQTILIVDDDGHIREVIRFALEKAGYVAVEARDGMEALKQIDACAPDLVVLDILMPEMDGTEVCRRIRARSTLPIVFLTSRDDEIDRILGLELGGDDYVTKPFSPRELVARVRAVLRRVTGSMEAVPTATAPEANAREIHHGRLNLDLDRFKAYWDQNEVTLTVTEFSLLRALMGFPGKVFTRDELITRAYGHDHYVGDRTIDSHVRRTRNKFAAVGGSPIETVHGLGYKLGDCH